MKQKLYYQDSYIKSFQASVTRQEQDAEGKWYVTLNQTAFYPTGGGQPHDVGTLNNVSVLDVEEADGDIRHYVDQPIFERLMEVKGEIDWNRRFDFMQQHAGQHILTASFVELFDIQTISFHLGKEMVTIDLDCTEVSEEQLSNVENLANQILLENRPIKTMWVTKEELSNYPLRKKVTVDEDIRLVIIPEFDYNGCGGTHPNSTAEVGSVKILHTEKQKGNVRIHFVCGGRVLAQLHRKQKVILEVTRLLSASEDGLSDAVLNILNHDKKIEKTLTDTKNLLFEYEAKDLVGAKRDINGVPSIQAIYQNRSIQELQKLARMVVSETKDSIVFLVAENDHLLQFVAARGENVDLSMKQLTANALSFINGKGGGSDAFAQGGGEASISSELLLEKVNLYMRS
ncbi:MAG: DHHA1 domain-containing protein [Paenisporosarcina sp.]